MKAHLIALLAALTLAAPRFAAAQVNSVEVHAGWVDLNAIVSGEKALPLSEPTVALEPAFDSDINSYTVRMPYGADGVTLVVEVSRTGDFGVIDFNGVGGQFQTVTYQQRLSFSEGKVVTFRLQPGDNQLRLGYRFVGSPDIYEFVITRPESASGDTTLAAMAVGGGELSPAFDPGTRTYRTNIVGDRLTVTPTPTATAGAVTVSGSAADGTALQVDGNLVSGLTAGHNTIAVAVQAEDGTSASYTLVVDARPSSDTTLAALQLDGGELSPSFNPDTSAYRTRIVGNALTVTATPSTGSVTVAGMAADGAPLQVDGATVSRLTAGENSIAFTVRAQDGSSESYTLIVEVSDDIREVAEGDTITRQADCDSDVGCDGTLNGVQGRLACDGVDWRSESSNMRISVSGLCLLSTSGDVVSSVAGWYFAAFPPRGR
ncbi:MAG: cadherin-like beta sandwich domain-containing protein [Rhodospirillaceae bacterium]|nr:cadherin-like beta sandwich domain-containing protein [Rhodospirillaceae bacterium]